MRVWVTVSSTSLNHVSLARELVRNLGTTLKSFTVAVFLVKAPDKWLGERSVCLPFLSFGVLSLLIVLVIKLRAVRLLGKLKPLKPHFQAPSFIIPGEALNLVWLINSCIYSHSYNYLLAQINYQFVPHSVLEMVVVYLYKQDVESLCLGTYNQSGAT
jgi:hypothetical protein